MTVFETRPCPRCGGSGHYSYCSRYGTTCFQCAGQKVALTKRGAAAKAFLAERVPRIRADQLAVGDSFADHRGWHRVIEPVVPDPSNPGYVRLVTKTCLYLVGAGDLMRVDAGPLALGLMVADALAYQETLTKAGKPRKLAPRRRSPARECAA
jgi:hypothetical protein